MYNGVFLPILHCYQLFDYLLLVISSQISNTQYLLCRITRHSNCGCNNQANLLPKTPEISLIVKK